MNKEEQKKLITEIMNEDAKDGLYHIVDTNKMVTAVKWILIELQKNFPKEIHNAYNSNQLLFESLFQQAKAMEKEQMEDCWIAAHQAGRFEGKGIAQEDWQTFFNYYNETYK